MCRCPTIAYSQHSEVEQARNRSPETSVFFRTLLNRHVENGCHNLLNTVLYGIVGWQNCACGGGALKARLQRGHGDWFLMLITVQILDFKLLPFKWCWQVGSPNQVEYALEFYQGLSWLLNSPIRESKCNPTLCEVSHGQWGF